MKKKTVFVTVVKLHLIMFLYSVFIFLNKFF